ncbi:MAG: PrsW family intramembrane metalloprotease [Erysipelotrichaceae bacterium]|nr:PrsW family intramembrane metalloprotease [Erysipelotrichaceae bacterium]
MAVMVLVLLLSFIPSILMFLFLRNNRKDDEVYRKDCNALLGKGLLICMIVFLGDLALKIPWNMTGIGEKYPLINEIFTCFIINALIEEGVKFLTANKSIKKDISKTSKLDVISYLVIAALSFGLLEDIAYVFSTNIGQIIVRGILMGHVPYAMLTGQLYGKGIAEKKKWFGVLGFILSVLLHGTYNFMLKDDLPDWSAFVVVTETALEFIYMICMIFFISKKRNDPDYNRPIFTGTEES